MIKHLLLFFVVFSFVSTTTFAQPTITASGFNPIIGNTFTLHQTGFVNQGNSGANQTWNLSAMSSTASEQISVVQPSSTSSGSLFPNANIALTQASGGASYNKTSSTYSQIWGMVNPQGVSIIYSNPDEFFRYPLNYNNTYTDSWVAQFSSGGTTFYRSGTTTVTVDGYGTVITPAGTTTNVLRIHYVQVYKDSAYLGMPYIINYNTDGYYWCKEGIHYTIASVHTISTSAGSSSTGGTYLALPTSVETIASPISSSEVYPNPTDNYCNYSFTLEENNDIELFIYNITGQLVASFEKNDITLGKNTIELYLGNLPEGIYYLKTLINGNISDIKKVSVIK